MKATELRKELETELMIYAKNDLLDKNEDQSILFSSLSTAGSFHFEKLACNLYVLHHSDNAHLLYSHDVYYVKDEDDIEEIAKSWVEDYCKENNFELIEVDEDNQIYLNYELYQFESEQQFLDLLSENDIFYEYIDGCGAAVNEDDISKIEELMIDLIIE